MLVKSLSMLAISFFLLTTLLGCIVQEPATHLEEALAFAPEDSKRIWFTDWYLLKQYEGGEELTSQSALDDQFAFIANVTQEQAAFTNYGLENAITDKNQTWGWNILDLRWEATIEIEGSSGAFVFQFPADFDFAPVIALYELREFETSLYEERIIYSHEPDPQLDWFRASQFAVANTVIIEEQNVMIQALELEALEKVLDAFINKSEDSYVEAEIAATMIEQMGEVAGAFIEPNICDHQNLSWNLLARPGSNLSATELTDLQEARDQLHPYEGIGIGYRYSEGDPVGIIVMPFADAADASADLELREGIIEEGNSLVSRQPFAETVFAINETFVENRSLIFQVEPTDKLAKRLLQSTIANDMLFALCP